MFPRASPKPASKPERSPNEAAFLGAAARIGVWPDSASFEPPCPQAAPLRGLKVACGILFCPARSFLRSAAVTEGHFLQTPFTLQGI